MRFFLFLFCFLISVAGAQASTLRISIDGYVDRFMADSVLSNEAGYFQPIGGSMEVDIHDPGLLTDQGTSRVWDDFRATSGVAFFREDGWNSEFTGCQGLLATLCWGNGWPRVGDRFQSGSYYHVAHVDLFSFYHADDSLYGWSFGGVDYGANNGTRIYGVVTRYEVAQVPVPASGALLASVLLCGLVLGRRRCTDAL